MEASVLTSLHCEHGLDVPGDRRFGLSGHGPQAAHRDSREMTLAVDEDLMRTGTPLCMLDRGTDA